MEKTNTQVNAVVGGKPVVKFSEIWNELSLKSKIILSLLILIVLGCMTLSFLVFEIKIYVPRPWVHVSLAMGIVSVFAIIIFFYCHGIGADIPISFTKSIT